MTIEQDDSLNDPELLEAVTQAVDRVLGGRKMMREGLVVLIDAINEDGERLWLVDSPDEQLHVNTMRMLDTGYRVHREIERLNIHAILRRDDDDE